MQLVATEEQEELRAALRRFFAERSAGAEVRRLMASGDGYDPKVWELMAGQLGLQGMAVPEEYGGAGFGVRELGVVFEEMGRALVCSPYLATVMAAAALSASSDEDAKRDLLPGIASGEVIATLAWSEDGRWGLDDVAMQATRHEDGWQLTGTKSYVLDGHLADLLLIAARLNGQVALFAVDGNAPGLSRHSLPTLDQTRKLARLDLANVPARPVADRAALARALDVGLVALAAEQAGGAQRVLDMTVEYLKVRKQFGRPIGGFQAVKHRCADMFVQVESARSAVLHAALVADESPGELPAAAALAKSYCSDAYFHVAGEGIQLHGGIGFTWEHDAHLYFKRAKSSQELFGSPDEHRRRLARLVGISADDAQAVSP
ncbi:acyl-CoA dehydrogenase family protein [Actinomadura hibisca]|uniref:acyl-CoA dehydrogenase family protein n=1 Tax=Actinomadura hibisca TaxID=68565 RepID=UPI00082FD8F2|nr:acyl-CoA dehydrogenase family protein [Actinomadura hibisca]